MSIDELKKEKQALAATISEAVESFQEKTGVYVNGIAVHTVVSVSGGGIGLKPTELRYTTVGIGISLEQP